MTVLLCRLQGYVFYSIPNISTNNNIMSFIKSDNLLTTRPILKADHPLFDRLKNCVISTHF